MDPRIKPRGFYNWPIDLLNWYGIEWPYNRWWFSRLRDASCLPYRAGVMGFAVIDFPTWVQVIIPRLSCSRLLGRVIWWVYSTVVTSACFTARVFYYDLVIVRYLSRCWKQVQVLVNLLTGMIRPIGLSRATKFTVSYSPETLPESLHNIYVYMHRCFWCTSHCDVRMIQLSQDFHEAVNPLSTLGMPAAAATRQLYASWWGWGYTAWTWLWADSVNFFFKVVLEYFSYPP